MSRRRQLSEEDEALWSGFARSITPLPPKKSKSKSKSESKPEAALPPAATQEAKTPPRAITRREPAPPAKSPALAPLDRRFKQRLARGRDSIDARIDLHGMTQTEAHHALDRFLRRAQSDGARIVLVVTGKGVGRNVRDASAERGVLRRQVPLWLALPEFRPLIVGFEEAHVSHGGQGALYVRVRRPR
jgi:DNA-nicking Smr family endonuclease